MMGSKEILRHRLLVLVTSRVEISFYERLHIHTRVVLSVVHQHSVIPPNIHTLNASCIRIRGTRALPFFFRFFRGMLYADRKKAISMKIMLPLNSFSLPSSPHRPPPSFKTMFNFIKFHGFSHWHLIVKLS